MSEDAGFPHGRLRFFGYRVLATHFVSIRLVHITCVALSGSLFCLRGLMRMAGIPAANHRVLRFTSYVVDTTLLVAAIKLALILHQYPFTDSWLTTKLLLLVLYIVLGTFALKRARTATGRTVAFLSALLTFAWISGVAITHQPAGWLTLIP
jgi:uncharacterized membrane protein SirB2